MKNIKNILRINYWIIIICFFLPFMLDTCIHDQLHPGERKYKDSIKEIQQDKENLNQLANDSINTNVPSTSLAKVSLDEKAEPFKEDVSYTQKIYNFIISPAKDNISGIGYIIYRTSWKTLSPALGLLLTLISLILAYRKNSRFKLLLVFSIINILGLIAMLILSALDFSAFLYGYWLMFIFYVVSLILNHKLIRNQKDTIIAEM